MVSVRERFGAVTVGLLLSFWVVPVAVANAPEDSHEGLQPIQWTLHPEAPLPSPRSKGVIVAVHEGGCTGGRNPIPHLGKPDVRYGKRAVVITLWIDPTEGLNTCPGNPIGRLKIRLPEALGNRKLYDGATDPPRKVKPGEDPRRLSFR